MKELLTVLAYLLFLGVDVSFYHAIPQQITAKASAFKYLPGSGYVMFILHKWRQKHGGEGA